MGGNRTVRNFFENYYGIKIPNHLDVHHIDNDCNNNDITNLLLLPHHLHMEYHEWLNEYLKIDHSSFDGLLHGYNQYNSIVINKFGEVLQRCQKWILRKVELDQALLLKEGFVDGN